METSKALPDFSALSGLVTNLNTQLPEWAQSTLTWLSESPAWATSILSQSSLVLHLSVNDQMFIRELESDKGDNSILLLKMAGNEKFHLHAIPGTHAKLKAWAFDQNEIRQALVAKILEVVPEMETAALKTWNAARNLFPVLGNTETPFLSLTFSFGGKPVGTEIPEPSSLRIWDMPGNAQLLTHLQQGVVSFYVCELNLPTLIQLVLQMTTVFALSVVKWLSIISSALMELMQGTVDSLRKIPKEVLLASLGVLAGILLIPAVREQLGEWLQQSKAWIEANYHQLMLWAGNWAKEMELVLEWLASLRLVGGLLTEQVEAELMEMFKNLPNPAPTGV